MKKLIKVLRIWIFLRKNAWAIFVLGTLATFFNKPGQEWIFLLGMQAICYSLLTIILSSILIKVKKELIHAKQRLESTKADCDVGDKLFEWRINMPSNESITLDDPVAQKLIRRQIKTKKKFLKMHKFIKNKSSYTVRFRSLLTS